MGMRLAGPPLAHRSPQHADIVSDGVAPGAIQVPADGQPIVLLADAQTVGGYPKLATVIRADLGRLARWPAQRPQHFVAVTRYRAMAADPVRAHRPLHFVVVTREQAHTALRQQHDPLQRWMATLRTYQRDGQLTPRREPGAVLHDATRAAHAGSWWPGDPVGARAAHADRQHLRAWRWPPRRGDGAAAATFAAGRGLGGGRRPRCRGGVTGQRESTARPGGVSGSRQPWPSLA